ncbi:MAG TPA: exonuclease SbcCD subunit D [Anaerolineae bacterium]|nr:exonuclease SbcCD subunit D [Anaerolineae bacterium]
MVRILHFADLHLGVENYGRPDPATGLHTRLLDFLRSFDEMVEYALEQSVDLVLFAGDAYKSRNPNPTHQREFARRIHRLASAGIPVFLLTGNHDTPSTLGRANTLDIFAALRVPSVHVGRKPGTHCIPTRSGPVQIVAVPWIVRSHLLSREEYKNRALSEIEELIVGKLEGVLDAELKGLDADLPTVLAAHGTVQGAVYGSERSVLLGQETILPRSLLRRAAFDYVALGHIHRHQVLGEDPPIVYSGSLDRIDFGEEREAKGFVVAEVERGRARYEFVELKSTRRFVTIRVNADGADPMAQVRQAIAGHDIKDAIVRLIIRTTMDRNQMVRDSEIRDLLGEPFKVAAVVRDVERPSRLRLGTSQNVERMTPLEALGRYLELREVPSERAEILLQYAERVTKSVDTGAD